jgi:hypothetical protein
MPGHVLIPGRQYLRSFLALLLLLLAVVGIGHGTAGANAPSFAMIGDSITWQATAHIEAAVPGMRVDGVIGRTFNDANDVLASLLAGGTPDVLVVALGTNPTLTLAKVDDFMSRTVGIDRVVFVNIRIPREWEAPTNELIDSLPSRYKKVSILDWYSFTATRPDVLNEGGFHLSDSGKPVYGGFIADGVYRVAACLDEPVESSKECVPNGSFVDDDWSVFESDIEWLAESGITKGCNPPANDRFCPDARVTRGEMAAFLVRALGLSDGLDDPFVDDDGSIFERDIERLAAARITLGCNPPTNDRFCPQANVTREQMAAFLVRAFGYDDDGGGDAFRDDNESIFEHEIERLAVAGVTRSCNPPVNDRFCPKSIVTRGQMAAFLNRSFLP